MVEASTGCQSPLRIRCWRPLLAGWNYKQNKPPGSSTKYLTSSSVPLRLKGSSLLSLEIASVHLKLKMEKIRTLLKQPGVTVIVKVCHETTESVLDFRRKKNKQWITPETWRKTDERRKAKGNLLCALHWSCK